MQGSSRAAAAAGEARFDAILEAGVDRVALAQDLFGLSAALDDIATLRRALGDPSRTGEAKADLARRLFEGKVCAEALDLARTLVSQRWAAERDLADTMETLGVDALVAQAAAEGRIDQVEDELFRFERIVAATPALRDAVTDRTAEPAAKDALVTRLLEDKSAPETLLLVRQAVRMPRGRRFPRIIEGYLEMIAARRRELSALITSAVELDATQRERLAVALQRIYGAPVHLNVVVDPAVVGGVLVQIGDEVIDGTIMRKLEGARRHFGA